MICSEKATIEKALYRLPPSERHSMNRALDALNDIEKTDARRGEILDRCEELLSQLRMDVKYLIFDLEATRRERDELKFRLDSLEE